LKEKAQLGDTAKGKILEAMLPVLVGK